MASVVVWKLPEEQWMADNHEGELYLFDSESAAIQSACDMELNKDNPDCVLVYKKNLTKRTVYRTLLIVMEVLLWQ